LHPERVYTAPHPARNNDVCANSLLAAYHTFKLTSSVVFSSLYTAIAAARSDEVYANSLFDESQQFVSAAHLLQQEVTDMQGAEHAGESGCTSEYERAMLRYGMI
jgi:hypothetical protein